nr:MAG TPA: hypothetical protein [Caudoviricetes sp.]
MPINGNSLTFITASIALNIKLLFFIVNPFLPV